MLCAVANSVTDGTLADDAIALQALNLQQIDLCEKLKSTQETLLSSTRVFDKYVGGFVFCG